MKLNLASMAGSWSRPDRVRWGEGGRGQRPGATCRPSPWRVRRATRDGIEGTEKRRGAEKWVCRSRDSGKLKGALRHRPRVGNPGAGPKIAQVQFPRRSKSRDGIREQETENKEDGKKRRERM